jgi:adenylate kinase family enzyme
MKKIEESQVVKLQFSDHLRDFFNICKVKRIFKVGTEMFSAAQPFIEKQTPINAVRSAIMIGKVIVEDLEVWPDDYFDDGWEVPYPTDFNKVILAALEKKPVKVIRTSDESVVIHMVLLAPNIRAGYVLNTRTNFVDKIYVEIQNLDVARDIIKQELWSMLRNENIVLRRVQRPGDFENCNVDFKVDGAFHPMPSQKAQEMSSYLKKCIDAEVSRSVLLYGPPGTGKSTMARTIVSSLGLRSFRIRVEDIADISTATVFEAIRIFQPDAIIIDDFDRLGNQASMLEALEYFQRHTKLVIATVNNKNRLDDAILRPGRFDELICVKQLDEEVIRNVLGAAHSSAFSLVKDWPIAFVQEYVKRRRFMTPKEAQESIRELADRAQRMLRSDDDENDVTGVLRKLNPDLVEEPDACVSIHSPSSILEHSSRLSLLFKKSKRKMNAKKLGKFRAK